MAAPTSGVHAGDDLGYRATPLSGTQLTSAEIKRTRQIRSRISRVEEEFFIRSAETAPWVPADSDLADADPSNNGLFEEMSALYWHFAEPAPRGVNVGKISKVLHLKRPQLFPVIDSRVRDAYRVQVKASRRTHPDLGWRRRTWITVRDDLLAARSSGALERLRVRLSNYQDSNVEAQVRVRQINDVTDLRLLDMLTWAPVDTTR